MKRKVLLSFVICLFFSSMTILPLTLNAVASPDEYIQLVFMSGSMRPTLEPGDMVTVETNVNASQIYAAPQPDGDIIAYPHPTYPESIIIHRAVEKNYVNGTWYFRTKGDANSGIDSWEIPEENIVGKVVALTRTFVAGTWSGKTYNVTIFSTGTLASFNFNLSQRVMSYNVTGALTYLQTDFVCNVTFPYEVLYEPHTVLLDSTQHTTISTSNATHISLYFTNNYAPYRVQISGTAGIPTFLAISTSAPSVYVGFQVNVSGTLRNLEGKGLSGATIVVSYAIPAVSIWTPITSVITGFNGRYSVIWIPPATGCFTLKTEWSGNKTYVGASNTTTLSILPYENQYVFFVESNSTLSSMVFNSTANELSFTAEGPDGTTGYARVFVTKELVANVSDLRVFVDGSLTDYSATSTDNSWLLYFTYTHSTHNVKIIIPEFPSFLILPLFVASTLVVIVYRRKHSV